MGNPDGGYFPARPVLFAHQPDQFGAWADKRDARSLADLGEIGVLGKEAVARVNRVHVR